MDDNIQFNIPNQDSTPPQNGEFSSAGQTENSAFLSPDIISMTDEPFDQPGYVDALSKKSVNAVPPQTIGQMVQGGKQRLDKMEQADYWNEGLDGHSEKMRLQENIHQIVKIDVNLEKWRDNESNTSSSGEDL